MNILDLFNKLSKVVEISVVKKFLVVKLPNLINLLIEIFQY